jgi:hypothetical protein
VLPTNGFISSRFDDLIDDKGEAADTYGGHSFVILNNDLGHMFAKRLNGRSDDLLKPRVEQVGLFLIFIALGL